MVIETAGPVSYVPLISGGYMVAEDWWCQSDALAGCAAESNDGTVVQSDGGFLFVKRGFRCDGPSGPTIDTPNFMAAAFAHDAGYRLCRESHFGDWQVWRKKYDDVLIEICKQRGMPWWRRAYIYSALRLFASGAAKPQPDIEKQIQVAP